MGVTISVTQGMATALASNPTSDTWLNSNKDSGVSASVTTHCSRATFRKPPSKPVPAVAALCRPEALKIAFLGSKWPVAPVARSLAAPESVANSTPTAINESQKPACISAHGSSTNTTAMASSQTKGHGQVLPPCLSKITVASIQMVRWAGTPQPENNAYRAASSKPPRAPALAAGNQRQSFGVQRTERRHSPAVSNEASQANIVMCKPEILMRWATPVALKTSQSARSIEF